MGEGRVRSTRVRRRRLIFRFVCPPFYHVIFLRVSMMQLGKEPTEVARKLVQPGPGSILCGMDANPPPCAPVLLVVASRDSEIDRQVGKYRLSISEWGKMMRESTSQ